MLRFKTLWKGLHNVIWCSKEYPCIQGCEILSSYLKISFPREYFFAEKSNLTPRSAKSLEDFLDRAEYQAGEHLVRKNTNIDIFNPEYVVNLLNSVLIDHLEGIRYGVDYNIEIRSRQRLITDENYPHLYKLIINIGGESTNGLENENHGFGYHLHYVSLKKQRAERTNLIFTFNPYEPEVRRPFLYSQHHHDSAHIQATPDRFGTRRRMAIYDSCTSVLSNIPKSEFLRLGKKSELFFPISER